MSPTTSKNLTLKSMEVKALLEITEAINANLPEESLYRIFEFTLRANLSVERMALYVLDDAWLCKVAFGTARKMATVALSEDLLKLRDITPLTGQFEAFSEFETVIPVAHKDRILAFVFLQTRPKEDGMQPDLGFVQALSNITLVAIENKKLARQQLAQQMLQKELEIAKRVQNYLIPEHLPRTRELSIFADYLPHNQVGGDYYDYIPLQDGSFVVCIADVSGKGIPASLLMSNFQATLRTILTKTHDLPEVVQVLNRQVKDNAKGEHFISAFVALCCPAKGELRYINSGHNPPILMHGGKNQELDKGTTLIGAFDELPQLEEGRVEGLGEFLLFCYTDGLTETFNPAGEPYGEERLVDHLERYRNQDLTLQHKKLLEELEAFADGVPRHDDTTLLSVHVQD